MAERDFVILSRQEYTHVSGPSGLERMLSEKFAAPVEPSKQNILPAISDDLYQRIQRLQVLYRIDGQVSTVEQILDRCVTALYETLPEDPRNAR